MELAQCTICQDFFEFRSNEIVAGICGHVFHDVCISQWRRNADNCPQCRKKFWGKDPVKLFFDMQVATEMDEADPAVLQNKVRDLNLRVDEKDKEAKDQQAKVKTAKRELKGLKLEVGTLRDQLDRSDTVNSALKRQLAFLEKHKEEAIKARQSAEKLQKNLDKLENIKALINGEREDVEQMLKNFPNSSESLNHVITSFIIMKKEFEKLKESKEKTRQEMKIRRKEVEELRRQLQGSFDQNTALQDQLALAETDLQYMEKERQNLLRKINSLEQAFSSPSPRASAIKRLLRESPAPMNAKRKRKPPLEEIENIENYEGTLQIDEGDLSIEEKRKEDSFTDSFNEYAKEIGLKVVATSSLATHSKKKPVSDSRKVLHMQNVRRSNSASSSTSSQPSSSSSCPVVQKGYNGLGGQSRFIKPSAAKKLSSKVRVPRSSRSKSTSSNCETFFMPQKHHPLPCFTLSP